MEAILGIFLFIVIIMLIVGLSTLDSDNSIWGMTIVLIVMGSFALGVISSKSKHEEKTYREIIRGNPPYHMEVTYQLKDSVYIPKDTLFIKNN